jgi:hypothetical protein
MSRSTFPFASHMCPSPTFCGIVFANLASPTDSAVSGCGCYAWGHIDSGQGHSWRLEAQCGNAGPGNHDGQVPLRLRRTIPAPVVNVFL